MGQLLDTGGEGYLCVGGRGVMGGLKFSHNCIRVHPPSYYSSRCKLQPTNNISFLFICCLDNIIFIMLCDTA